MIPQIPHIPTIGPAIQRPLAKSKPVMQALSADHCFQAQEQAKKMLSGDPAFDHNATAFRYFGMVHCATAIKGSKHEGGDRADAFDYWGKILTLPEHSFPVSHGLSQAQLDAARDANADLIHFNSLMVMENASIAKSKNIIKAIRDRCVEKGFCYIPAGWNGVDNGHYATLKARLLKDGRLAFRYLNYGAGIQYHRNGLNTSTKNKPEFRSDEYAMGQNESEDFIARLILLKHDKRPFEATKMQFDKKKEFKGNITVIQQVGEQELYALLPLLGELIKEDQAEKLELHGVTQQRSGTCPMQNTRAVTTDALLTLPEGISPERLKRMQFSFKLASIVEAFKAYQANKVPHNHTNRSILRYALHELNVRCNKLFPEILTSEELAISQKIEQQIIAVLDQEEKVELDKACTPYQLPEMFGPAIEEIDVIEFDDKAAAELKEQDAKSRIEQPSTVPTVQRKEKLTPENVVEYLMFNTNLRGKTLEQQIMETLNVMQSLPTCSGEINDSFWDQVPDKDLGVIFVHFEQLRNIVDWQRKCSHYSNTVYLAEICLIMYDIAAQLFQRTLRLKNLPKEEYDFLTGFAFTLSDVYQDQYFFYDADSYVRVKKIIDNFKKRCEGKRPIFGNIIRQGDESQQFLLNRNMFTPEQRIEWCQKQKGMSFPPDYDDAAIFHDLMKSENWTGCSGVPVREIVRLSIGAHSFGFTNVHKSHPYVYCSSEQHGRQVFYLAGSGIGDRLERRRDRRFPQVPKGSFIENAAFYPFRLLVKEGYDLTRDPSFAYTPNGTNRRDYEEHYISKTAGIGLIPDEEFRAIEANTQLQVQKTLEWATYNVSMLSKEEVQVRIFTLLFEYGKIEDAFALAHEELSELIQSFLQKSFDYYLKENFHLGTVLWLSEVCHYLKDHFVKSNLPHAIQWIDTRKMLVTLFGERQDAKERAQIARRIVHSYLSETELSDRDALTVLQYSGVSLGEASHDFVVTKILIRHQERIQEAVKANLNAFANETIRLSKGVIISTEWRIEGTSIIDKGKKFAISLATGNVTYAETFARNIYKELKGHNPYEYSIECLVDLQPMTIQLNEDREEMTVTSSNGEWVLKLEADTYVDNNQYIVESLKRKVIIGGKEIEFSRIPFNKNFKRDDSTDNLVKSMHLPEGPEDMIVWKSDNPKCFLLVPKGKHPNSGYLYRSEVGWQRIQRDVVTNHWKLTNALFLDWNDKDTFVNQWRDLLGNFDSHQHINVEMEQLDDKQKVTKIEFKRLGVSFVPVLIGKTWKLESVEYPGFYLDTDRRSLRELNGLPSVFILKNNKGEEHIILPAFSAFTMGKCPVFQDPKALFRRQGDTDAGVLFDLKPPYFTYHRQEGRLIGSSPEANLYLSVVYAGQEDYSRAMDALERANKPTKCTDIDWKIAWVLLHLENQTALGSAFLCHVTLYLYHHEKKRTLRNIPRNIPLTLAEEEERKRINDGYNFIDGGSPHEIFKIAKEKFVYYLENISAFKFSVNAIYEKLRLNEFQVKTLESILRVSKSYGHRPQPIITDEFSRINNSENIDWPAEGDVKESEERQPFVRVCGDPSRIGVVFENLQHPALTYILKNFISLADDALSDKEYRRRRFLTDWYFLYRNETTAHQTVEYLLTYLKLAYIHRDKFKNFEETRAGIKSAKVYFSYIQSTCLPLWQSDSLQWPAPAPDRAEGFNWTLNRELDGQYLEFAIDPVNAKALIPKPLGEFVSKYFKVETETVNQGAFPLSEAEMKVEGSLGKLERYLLKRFETAKGRTKEVFTSKPERENLKTEIENKRSQDLKLKNDLEKELLEMANVGSPRDPAPSVDRARHILQQTAYKAKQRYEIDIGDLVFSMLKQKTSFLTEKNCFLTQAKLQAIYSKLAEYCLVKSRIDQADEALRVIDEASEKWDVATEQLVGGILNKQRTYKVEENPEFLVYEYATGNMLRPKQVEVLQWAIKKLENDDFSKQDYRHLLIQFAAAGGKTAVIIPILAHRFASKSNQILSIIMNTPEMYSVGVKDIPESLKKAFKRQMVEVFEVELDYKWTVFELDKLHEDIRQWINGEKVVLMTPIVWHSINCTKKKAYVENDLKLASAAEFVLNCFKNVGLPFIDESHIICDSLQQSIKTFGPVQRLTDDQKLLGMRFYDYLFGDVDESDVKEEDEAQHRRKAAIAEIAEIAGMKGFNKKIVNADGLAKIKEVLAREISRDTLFAELQAPEEVYKYLSSPRRKKPKWLERLYEGNPREKELANLVVCARSFIQTHLKHILTLQHGKNYGGSVHRGDMTAAPKHDGGPTAAYFAEAFLKMALTIQLAKQDGVPEAHIKSILRDLKRDHNDQKKYCGDGQTMAEVFFYSILPKDKQSYRLDKLTVTEMEDLSKDLAYRKQRAMIRKYVYDYALPQIEMPLCRVSSTAPELQAGFKRSVNFSATTGLLETYPVTFTEEDTRFELDFEREVIETLLGARNSESCLVKSRELTAESFFGELLGKFPNLTGLIDRGALFCSEKPEKVVAAYLKASTKGKSVVYSSGQETVIQQPGVANQIRFAGTRIVQELRKKEIDFKKLALFLYLELRCTTGWDMQQAYQACSALTVGPEQTITQTIQAAMRQRQLLEYNAQTIIWVLLEALYKEINPGAVTFDPKVLFIWMLRNEASQVKKKLIMRAYQGIDQVIKGHVWKLIERNKQLYPTYKAAIEEQTLFEPYKIYEIESEERPAKDVLEAYIDEMRAKFIDGKSALSEREKEQLQTIVTQTVNLIETMTKPHGVELNGEVYQQQAVQQHQNQDQNQNQDKNQQMQIFHNIDENSDFTFQAETYSPDLEGLTVPRFLEEGFSKEYAQYDFGDRVPVSGKRLPSLIIHGRYLSPMLNFGSKAYTKPITNLLVQLLPDGSCRFLACTAAAANFYVEEFRRIRKDNIPLNAKYAIVGFDNHILSSLGLENGDRQVIKNEANLMTNYLAFLNGRVKNPHTLKRLIDRYHWSYSDYKAMADVIAARHVSKLPIELLGNRVLEQLCGWKGEKGRLVLGMSGVRKVSQLNADQPDVSKIDQLQNINIHQSDDLPPPRVELKRRSIKQILSSAWKWLGRMLQNLFCCRCRC